MNKLLILSIFFSLYIFTSCSSNNDVPLTDVTYTSTIKTIIDTNCLICHSNPPVNDAPMPLTTYESVKEAIENRNLIGRVVDGTMPPSGNLTATQIQAIKDWKTEGFIQ